MKRVFFVFLLFVFLVSCQKNELNLKTKYFQIGIDRQGRITKLYDRSLHQNYLPADTSSYLMSVRYKGKILFPERAEFKSGSIILWYKPGLRAEIHYEQKPRYLTFELVSLSDTSDVDLIIWGPYGTTIKDTIGETVGVVRNRNFAIGLQALNIKTLGGYPWNESDRMPQFDIFSSPDIDNMHPKNDGSTLYRVEAAKPTTYGSSLQAYCRNRNKSRVIRDFGQEILTEPYYDGGVIGSKIALFGCPSGKVLKIIGQIEIEQGLPHTEIDGHWAKTCPYASFSYLIYNYNEKNIRKAIQIAQKAGFKYIYYFGHSYKSWGHYQLNPREFPHGYEGLRNCVKIADSCGIKLGMHTLSNFINTNDPYVTPVPDSRLAYTGYGRLTHDISPDDTVIAVESPGFFNQKQNNTLKTVRIDSELITYQKVTSTSPYKLTGCQRGALGTKPSKHKAGSKVYKLLDHPYKVFLSNPGLSIEIAKNIANLFNKTGLRMISFDGLEGNRSTGLGEYGEALMPYVWYNSLADSIKHDIVVQASRTTHFFWHIYTRMNWGEPWYGDFRESQQQYRFRNQAYYQRNYMPAMLGWFLLTPTTSLEDIQWLLSHAAGFNAGFALVVRDDALEYNKLSDTIFSMIKTWESLRMQKAFPDTLRKLMQNPNSEFTLRKKLNHWTIYSVNVDRQTLALPAVIKLKISDNKEFTEVYIKPVTSKTLHLIFAFDTSASCNVRLDTDNIIKITTNGDLLVLKRTWDTVYRQKLNLELQNKSLHILNIRTGKDNGTDDSVKIEIRTLEKGYDLISG